MLPISSSEDNDGSSCVRVPTRGLPPPHEEGPSAPRSTDTSSPAVPTIAPPVVSPPLARCVEDQRLFMYAPGGRSKATGEHPST